MDKAFGFTIGVLAGLYSVFTVSLPVVLSLAAIKYLAS